MNRAVSVYNTNVESSHTSEPIARSIELHNDKKECQTKEMVTLKDSTAQSLHKKGKATRLAFLLFFPLFACFLFTCSDGEQENKPRLGDSGKREYRPAVGYSAPDFSLPVMGEERRVNLSDYRGKVVLLNFWATWCVPCRKEMPSMEELYSLFKEREFEILAVNLEKFAAEKVSLFVSNYGLTFPILIDKDQGTALTYQVRAVPTTYVIGKDGVIRERIVGGRNWTEQEFVERLESLVGS